MLLLNAPVGLDRHAAVRQADGPGSTDGHLHIVFSASFFSLSKKEIEIERQPRQCRQSE